MHADAQPRTKLMNVRVTREPFLTTLLLTAIALAILAIFWPTTQSMLETWRRSSTYGHCYLVIPIAIAMAWRQSMAPAGAPLTVEPFRPFWPGLALVAAVGFAWLLGEIAGVAVVAQFAVIGMVVATALTVWGKSWARRLAFPLAFLFFAVPFGEGLLPFLMQWTADATVAALRVTGVPVYQEGNYFVVPTGSWSIIEACGGVRYLIAALMTGCVFAWLQYRSLFKRIVFVAAALIVALVSNWLRAYAIVLMGQWLVGADHNTWGWLIFAVSMFGLFAAGMRWSDGPSGACTLLAQPANAPTVSMHAIPAALVAGLLTAAVWPILAAQIESRVDTRAVRIDTITPRGNWQAAPLDSGNWAPELVAPKAVAAQSFTLNRSVVNVYLGVYRGQKQGAELVNMMNRVVDNDSKRWRLIQSGAAEVRIMGEPTTIRTALVRSANEQLLIWHWYWLAGHTTSSDVRVKVQLALQRLSGVPDTAAWVAVYTQVDDDIGAGARRLNAFVEAMSGSIDSALATTAQR